MNTMKIGQFDPQALHAAVKVGWQGMLGIFAVMVVIALLVRLFSRFGK